MSKSRCVPLRISMWKDVCFCSILGTLSCPEPHICEWVMSYVWMSHVTCVNELCHMCERVMSRVWMSHVTCVNESCHMCEWVKSHTWMSYATYVQRVGHALVPRATKGRAAIKWNRLPAVRCSVLQVCCTALVWGTAKGPGSNCNVLVQNIWILDAKSVLLQRVGRTGARGAAEGQVVMK